MDFTVQPRAEQINLIAELAGLEKNDELEFEQLKNMFFLAVEQAEYRQRSGGR